MYIGTIYEQSDFSQEIIDLLSEVQIPVTQVAHPLMAESRNSSLYVHPALFMNKHALKAVFEGMTVPFYVYKLFPEGPITMQLIAEMRQMWQEVMAILKHLNIDTLNLLKFMVKENYPFALKRWMMIGLKRLKHFQPSSKNIYYTYVIPVF